MPSGQSGDGVKKRRLSMTIKSDDANALAWMDNKVEVVNDPQRSVTSRKTLNFENFGHDRAQCVSK